MTSCRRRTVHHARTLLMPRCLLCVPQGVTYSKAESVYAKRTIVSPSPLPPPLWSVRVLLHSSNLHLCLPFLPRERRRRHRGNGSPPIPPHKCLLPRETVARNWRLGGMSVAGNTFFGQSVPPCGAVVICRILCCNGVGPRVRFSRFGGLLIEQRFAGVCCGAQGL